MPTSPRPGTAAWWLAREQPSTRQRRHRSLTLEAILDASLELLDARGAAGLTMRSVAGALAGVGSDDEFEVGLNALLTGFRHLIDSGALPSR